MNLSFSEVINMSPLSLISNIIQQTGNKITQTYQVEVAVTIMWSNTKFLRITQEEMFGNLKGEVTIRSRES